LFSFIYAALTDIGKQKQTSTDIQNRLYVPADLNFFKNFSRRHCLFAFAKAKEYKEQAQTN